MPAFLAIAGVPAMLGTAAAGGVAAGATIYGSKKASAASNRAANVTDRANRAAEEESRAQREEERRRWEAEQEQAAREFAALEEERRYTREKDEYEQRLKQEREARMAPYRAMSAQALGSLGHMLGFRPPAPAQTPQPRPVGSGQPPAAANGRGRILVGPDGGISTNDGSEIPVWSERYPGMEHEGGSGWGTVEGRGPDGMMRLPSSVMMPRYDPMADPRMALAPRKSQFRTLGDVTGLRRMA